MLIKSSSIALLCGLLLPGFIQAQVQLSALDTPFNVNLGNVIQGVVNGPFTANVNSVGSGTPGIGDLNANAWHIYEDGSSSQAINLPADFPTTLMPGQGFNQFPPLPSVGLHATAINGVRALGFQPSGNNFTSGSVTLRIQNQTSSVINALTVAYDMYVFNDRDRSNSVNLYYSVNNQPSSYEIVPQAEVVSPGTADQNPVPVNNAVNVPIDGLNIAPNSFIYLRWVFEDVTGNGERDEFVLLNIQLTPSANMLPVIIVEDDYFNLHQILGTTPVAQSVLVNAANLTGPITVEVPAPFQLSTDNVNYTSLVFLNPSNGVVNAPLYFRLNGGIPANYLNEVVFNSPGANEVEVLLNGRISPQLFINEFMAVNQTTIADEFGEFDDWIEVYNPSGNAVDLSGYFLTDDLTNLTKYKVPDQSSVAQIQAGSWLIFWADNQSFQGDLHTSFGLGAVGEDVVLVGIDGLTIVDSYSFEVGTADISEGRQTDGGSPWVFFGSPTPNASNNVGAPFLSASPIGLSGFLQDLGAPSPTLSFVVSGQNLTDDITIAVTSPFEISLNASSGFAASLELPLQNGNITPTIVHVRLNASAEGEYLGQSTVTSGSQQASVSLQGIAGEDPGGIPNLYINEFMPSNQMTIADEFGEFDDWIEIYNPNGFPVDLAGYYISDDLTNITKYQIPANTNAAVIPAFGFLLIWADNSSSQGPLHTNFALSASGEDVVLTAPDGETIIDQYTYSSAQTDVSEGRAGDGAPAWILFQVPTPGASNGTVNIAEHDRLELVLYPVPVRDVLNVKSPSPIDHIDVFSADGRLVTQQPSNALLLDRIDFSALPGGCYLVRVHTQAGTTTQRVIK